MGEIGRSSASLTSSGGLLSAGSRTAPRAEHVAVDLDHVLAARLVVETIDVLREKNEPIDVPLDPCAARSGLAALELAAPGLELALTAQ